jgi:hypothetical protein
MLCFAAVEGGFGRIASTAAAAGAARLLRAGFLDEHVELRDLW